MKKTPDEMIGHTCHHFWADPSTPCENCPSLKALVTKKTECTIIHTSDGRVWEERGEPIFDGNDNLIGVVEIATDITEHKNAEKELKESEEKYRLLTENAADVIWILNLTTCKFAYISPSVYQLRGFTAEEAMLETLEDSLTPESIALVKDAIAKYIPKFIAHPEIKNSFINEIQQYCKNGEIIWVEVSTQYRYNPIGEIEVVGVSRNIEKRKKVEEDLRKSELLLREAGHLAKLGGWTLDLATSKLSWTEETYHIHELATSINPRLEDGINFYAPEAQLILTEAIERAINIGESFDLELPFITAKGNHLWVRSIGNADLQNGIATRLYGVFQDITERKQTEEELRKTNSYLENLINYANAPIIVWDPQFRITRFNHAFEHLTGLTEKEVLGQSLEILFPPALTEHSMQLIRQTLTGERWEIVEIQIQHKDHSVRTVLWNSATLFALDGKTPLATIAQGQDITKRIQAEDLIRQKNLQLEQLNTEKDKFFSIIAHDMRGPFNGFLGLTQLLIEGINSLTLTQLQDISMALNKSAKNLFNLLNNLLEWARMQQGATIFEPNPLPLLPFVTTTLQPLLGSANKKGIELSINIPKDIQVFADENMLSSTIRNLTSNAIKFTLAGGKVSLSAKSAANNEIEISLKDTGIGMDAEMLDNMFKLDVSISRKGTDNEPSTGLGLLLCKDFIEKHGGRIRVESEEGKGSAFHFTLPNSVSG